MERALNIDAATSDKRRLHIPCYHIGSDSHVIEASSDFSIANSENSKIKATSMFTVQMKGRMKYLRWGCSSN